MVGKPPLPVLELIKDGMPKNHGYYRYRGKDGESAVISCERGVFCFTPPGTAEDVWRVKRLTDYPWSIGVRKYVTEFWYKGSEMWKEDLAQANRKMRRILDLMDQNK